jgi:hypothetical protein
MPKSWSSGSQFAKYNMSQKASVASNNYIGRIRAGQSDRSGFHRNIGENALIFHPYGAPQISKRKETPMFNKVSYQ